MKIKNKKIRTFQYIKNIDIFDAAIDRVNNTSNSSNIIIPHVCNNVDAFGAGFASAVAKRFPIAKENYHLLGLSFLQKNPGHVQFINVYNNTKTQNNIIIANMIAQNGLVNYNNPRPLNYAFLVKSMLNIKQYMNTNSSVDSHIEIYCPKFGSGLAGGNWNFIEDLIEDIWNQFKVLIFIK